jgi:uncharacterized protein
MLKRLLPRQTTFFELFQQAVDKLQFASIEFSEMLQHLDNQQHYVDKISNYEKEADRIAHANFELLHKTFITPFDRHNIHELTSALDDIIDLINRITQRFPFYELKVVPAETVMLSLLSVEATHHLKKSVYCLHSLKNSADIFKHCNEIDRVEGEAHQIVIAGEKKLFLEEQDFKQFFKLKEIYAHTKLVINRCQDVANILRGIVLEYS